MRVRAPEDPRFVVLDAGGEGPNIIILETRLVPGAVLKREAVRIARRMHRATGKPVLVKRINSRKMLDITDKL